VEVWIRQRFPARVTRRIHEEIIIEAPIKESETAAQIIRDSMIEAGQWYLKDVSVADNWYEKMMGLMEQPEQYHLEPSWVVGVV
jgi:DNA polymerase I-like protein with 3'-5' exonuclease and polymerase domains